jgi:hypothetical protein
MSVADEDNVSVDILDFPEPTARVRFAISEKWIGGNGVAKVKPCPTSSCLRIQGQISEKVLLAETQDRIRVAPRSFGHFSEPARASRILIEPDRVVVISSNNQPSRASHVINHRTGLGAIIHKVTYKLFQNPP